MMISTAILMEMGADQASVRPATDQRSVLEDISFAQSLDEGVRGTTEMLRNHPAGQVSTGTQTLSDKLLPVKITNEAPAVLPELQGKTVVAGERPLSGAVKGTDSRKTISPQMGVVTGAQAETPKGNSDTSDVQSLSDVECATQDSSTIPQDAEHTSFKNAFVPQVNVEGQSLASSSEEILIQRGNAKIGVASEAAPTERNAKKTSKIATTPHLAAIAPAPTLAATGQDSDLRMGHTIGPVTTTAVIVSAPPKSDPNSTSDFGPDGGVSTGKSHLVATTVMTSSVLQKDTLGEKVPEDGTSIPPSIMADQLGSPKPIVGAEKLLPAATTAMDDNGARTESTSGLSITVVHATTATAVAASNIEAREDSSSNANLIKLTTGEGEGPATGFPVGFRGQDISGTGRGSLDGPQMLTSTPSALEVGIQSGTHGWLKVRAEMTETGLVNASVSASSATGQEMLHRELPALTAYLQSEKVAVNAVIVHATTVESRGASTGMDGGSDGQSLQRGNQEGGRRQGDPETALNVAAEAVTNESLNAVDQSVALPLATYVSGGSWLSIRA